MSDAISVLVVDDEEDARDLLTTLLQTLGFRVEVASTGELALARLAAGALPDVVLLDVLLPGIDGLETLKRYREADGRQPVIMISGRDEVDTVVRAMRLGATDYVTKPFDPDELREILGRVAGDGGRPHPIAIKGNTGASSLGQSPAMRRVGSLIERIADADVPVLITGESGVGKDVVSREIHAHSARRDRPFVKINCAALPGELLESELFGHERGSFTGAHRTKEGQFELANGGTLFLDEIGEMPVSLQAKLLQALQDGEFYRVGGQKKIRVDARVIVATNVDLDRAIRAGTFREDLYYRLNVVRLSIPPLRDRREDIPSLLEHFLEKYGKRYNRSVEITAPMMTRLLGYDWPGNIRELENLVRRLMVLQDPHYVLDELKDRAPPPVAVDASAATTQGAVAAPGAQGAAGQAAASATGSGGLPVAGSSQPPSSDSLGQRAHALYGPFDPEAPVDDFRIDLKEIGRQAAHVAEREAIVTMLGHTGGNKRESAERLGISYKAILYKIREFGIGRPRLARRPPPRAATESAAPEATLKGKLDGNALLGVTGAREVQPVPGVDALLVDEERLPDEPRGSLSGG